MKHILNNISSEEKKSILEQHNGGILIETKNFQKLISNKLGSAKPLISEQATVQKINLPDGNYLGEGSGNEYKIKDSNGTETGYEVTSTVSIRGFEENDPVTIKDGVPTSKTWGVGGTYKYTDVGYKPTTQERKKVTSKISDGIQNVLPAMIQNPPFNGEYSGYVFGGEFQGTYYEWDANGVSGMSGVRGLVKGQVETENNSYLSKLGITDADPQGTYIGFYGNGSRFACYKTTGGTMKCANIK